MSKRKMAIEIQTNDNQSLRALAVNVKDGYIMTVNKVEDPLPTRGYRVHFYGMDVSEYDNLSKPARLAKATYELQERLIHEVYTGVAYFVKKPSGKLDIEMQQMEIITPFSIYDQVLYHTQNMLMGFFGSRAYREFVQAHDRQYQLQRKIKHEEEAVSRHQRNINAMKNELQEREA